MSVCALARVCAVYPGFKEFRTLLQLSLKCLLTETGEVINGKFCKTLVKAVMSN